MDRGLIILLTTVGTVAHRELDIDESSLVIIWSMDASLAELTRNEGIEVRGISVTLAKPPVAT